MTSPYSTHLTPYFPLVRPSRTSANALVETLGNALDDALLNVLNALVVTSTAAIVAFALRPPRFRGHRQAMVLPLLRVLNLSLTPQREYVPRAKYLASASARSIGGKPTERSPSSKAWAMSVR